MPWLLEDCFTLSYGENKNRGLDMLLLLQISFPFHIKWIENFSYLSFPLHKHNFTLPNYLNCRQWISKVTNSTMPYNRWEKKMFDLWHVIFTSALFCKVIAVVNMHLFHLLSSLSIFSRQIPKYPLLGASYKNVLSVYFWYTFYASSNSVELQKILSFFSS